MRNRLAAGIEQGLWIPVALLVLVGAMLTWWTWEHGAFFGTVFYPGAILSFGVLAVLLLGAPLGVRIAGPTRIALGSLIALGAFTLIGSVWSPAPTVAFADAAKVLTYAALFAIGVWACRMLDDRPLLALGPVAVTGLLVGVGIVITLASGHDIRSYVHSDDATLRFPLGYRNAEAAFLFISAFALLALAVEGRAPWPLRALMLAGTTMLLELNALAQSRGSLPAAAVALVVYLVLSPHRLRPIVYLMLAAAPVALALPTLLDVFRQGFGPNTLSMLRDSSRAIALTSLLSLGVAAVFLGVIEPRVGLGAQWTKPISRGLAAVAIAVVAIGTTVFVAERGGPAHFLNQKLGEFNRNQSPSFSGGTRFGGNVSSQRSDLWRVSLDEFADHPIVGEGPGAFEFAYLRDRHTYLTPKDPHSVEMLMLAELGVVGSVLFAAFLVGATAASLRTRRLGPPSAGLAAGALACGAYWLVHSSFDWFWRYPAVTAPAVFLLGAAAAPALASAGGVSRRTKAAVTIALAVLTVGIVPFYLSQRYSNRALGESGSNLAAAYDDLDSAALLDPFDDQSLLLKGVLAGQEGEKGVAIGAFREAINRIPEDYAGHYFLAKETTDSNPALAAAEITRALALNPTGDDVRALAKRIRAAGDKRFR